jgi:nicotinate-nucleotide adenylyltransferase
MKLALYGGSFDPPHAGHIAVIARALEVLPIDRLIVVPASRNPFKPRVIAGGERRIEWLKELLKGYERVDVSDFEVSQHRSVYTIETVRHFLPLCDELYLIIGADNLETLHTWHRFDELDRTVRWVVASRGGKQIPPNMILLDVDVPISSTDFRNSLTSLGLEREIEHTITTYYKEHL